MRFALIALAFLACNTEPVGAQRPEQAGGLGGSPGTAGPGSGSGGSAAGSLDGTAGVVGGGAAGSSALGGAAGTGAQAAGVEAGAGGSGGEAGEGSLPSGTLTFVAVGYSGRRIRSHDGIEWTDDVTSGGGGDDEHLLRAVTFSQGMFIAAGWKIWTSPDGSSASWQEQTAPSNWLGGLADGNGRAVGTGGYGLSAYSTNGTTWQSGGNVSAEIGQNQASRSLAFGAGIFVSATDAGDWWQSTNGESWTHLSGGHSNNQVAYCNGDFHQIEDCTGSFNARGHASAGGIHLRIAAGALERSTDGDNYEPVSAGTGLEDVTFGYVL